MAQNKVDYLNMDSFTDQVYSRVSSDNNRYKKQVNPLNFSVILKKKLFEHQSNKE